MARTHKIQKARDQRQLGKVYKQKYAESGFAEVNVINQEIKALGDNNDRHGNNRKMYAKLKVVERRQERARLNSKIGDE